MKKLKQKSTIWYHFFWNYKYSAMSACHQHFFMLLTYGPGYPKSPFGPGVPIFPEIPWKENRETFTFKAIQQSIVKARQAYPIYS